MVEQRVVVPLTRVQFPLATHNKKTPDFLGSFYYCDEKDEETSKNRGKVKNFIILLICKINISVLSNEETGLPPLQFPLATQ